MCKPRAKRGSGFTDYCRKHFIFQSEQSITFKLAALRSAMQGKANSPPWSSWGGTAHYHSQSWSAGLLIFGFKFLSCGKQLFHSCAFHKICTLLFVFLWWGSGLMLQRDLCQICSILFYIFILLSMRAKDLILKPQRKTFPTCGGWINTQNVYNCCCCYSCQV